MFDKNFQEIRSDKELYIIIIVIMCVRIIICFNNNAKYFVFFIILLKLELLLVINTFNAQEHVTWYQTHGSCFVSVTNS